MSRIGRAPITVPAAAKVTLEEHRVSVEGPRGKLSLTLPPSIRVTMDGQQLKVACSNGDEALGAVHGLYRALLNNMVQGTVQGFSKELEIIGVGYRAQMEGKQLTLNVGFSHQVRVPIPEGLTVETPKPTTVVVKGADRQLVGQFSANIRHIAPPEPYKGKGIRYAGEVIRRKAGKAATGTGAKAGS